MISHFKGSIAASLAALVAAGTVMSTAVVAAAADQTAAVSSASAEGDCGSIDLASAGAAQISAAASCFQQAVDGCKAAQLKATWQTQDETVERDIIVSPGDYSCMILESVTHTPKGSAADSSAQYRCAGAASSPDGLVIRGCGADGDVRIVAAH